MDSILVLNLICDQTIELAGARAENCPIRLRRIGYKDADMGIHYTFLTNNFTLTARTSAPGDEAVRLTFPIDCKPVEFRSWVRQPCLAVQAKTDENWPEFPPESLLKEKKEAECQDQCLLANDQQGAYSSYTRLMRKAIVMPLMKP